MHVSSLVPPIVAAERCRLMQQHKTIRSHSLHCKYVLPGIEARAQQAAPPQQLRSFVGSALTLLSLVTYRGGVYSTKCHHLFRGGVSFSFDRMYKYFIYFPFQHKSKCCVDSPFTAARAQHVKQHPETTKMHPSTSKQKIDLGVFPQQFLPQQATPRTHNNVTRRYKTPHRHVNSDTTIVLVLRFFNGGPLGNQPHVLQLSPSFSFHPPSD